jgi:flagellar hook-length control protein FliK
MADISAQAALNSSSDVKIRFASDLSNGQDASGQFIDVMLAEKSPSPAAPDNSNADLAALNKTSADNAVAARMAKKLNTKKDDEAVTTMTIKAATTAKVDVKAKIKAKIKDIISRDQTPVNDTKALDALKKVATFLLKASQDGQISLPKELTQKLQDFLNKGDDLKAADIVDFMQDFITAFRQMLVPLTATPSAKTNTTADVTASAGDGAVDAPANGDAKAALVWPKDIADAFKDLKLNGFAPEGEKVTPLDVMRAVKMLVNASQDSATASLDEKANEALTKKDDAATLIPVAAEKDDAVTLIAAAPEKDAAAPNDAKSPDAAKILVEAKAAAAAPVVSTANQAPSIVADKASDVAVALPQPKFSNETNKKSDLPAAKPAASNDGLLPQPAVNGAALRSELNTQGSTSVAAKPAAAPVVSSASTLSPALNNVLNNDQAQPQGISQVNQNRFNDMVTKVTQTLNQNSGSAVEQVIVQLQARNGKSSITVQLTPAELGRVDVRMDTKANGQTHVVLSAEKPETLALLQKDAGALQKALQQAGINANAENMSFNLREQRNGQGFTRQKFTRNEIEDAPKELALNVHGDGDIISDTRVNYHA